MCMLTLTSVKFDSQSRTRWCLSTLILNNDCTRTHERAGERASERVTERATEWTDEQASARKMTYDKYNNNNNNKWIVLGWACKQSVELCSTQTCVRCWHTHTHARTQIQTVFESLRYANFEFGFRYKHEHDKHERVSKGINALALTRSLASYSYLIFLLPALPLHSPPRIALPCPAWHTTAVCLSCSMYSTSLSLARSLSCKKEITRARLLTEQMKTKTFHTYCVVFVRCVCERVYVYEEILCTVQASLCTCSLGSYSNP